MRPVAIRIMLRLMAAITVSPSFARSLILGLLFCLIMAALTACASKEKDLTSGAADGAPVERKVFYKGWGWSKDD